MSAFWLQDPSILLKKDYIFDIIPKNGMTKEQQLNAISRFIIALSMLGYFTTMSYNIIILGLVSLGIVALLSNFIIAKPEGFVNHTPDSLNYASYSTGKRIKQPRTAQSPLTFQSPTTKDPLMNVLLTDIKDRPNRPPAEPAFNPSVERDINKSALNFVVNNMDVSNLIDNTTVSQSKLKTQISSDLSDNLEFNNSMRPFFATPNTKIPNDQQAFANFCYGSMISCKEGNIDACTR